MKKKHLQSPSFGLKNKLYRSIWAICYLFFFRFSPTPMFGWRRLLLRIFGAKVGVKCNIYPSVRVWSPLNLYINDNSTLGPYVDIYNQGAIRIGKRVTISQGAYLCASTHNYNNKTHPLILAPIKIKDDTWVCAQAFIGPNCEIDTGTVVGARAVVTKDTEAWGVYAGNPASKVNIRKIF